MISILSFPLTQFHPEDRFLRLLPENRRDRILQTIHDSRKSQRFLSDLLLFDLLHHYTKSPAEQMESIQINQYGKPFFSSGNLSFSISHSKELVTVSVSDEGEIGIDIEPKNRNVRDSLRHAFSDHDIKQVQAKDLLSLWVRKEAFTKCVGQGLLMPNFKEISIWNHQLEYHRKMYYLTDFQPGFQHLGTICTTKEPQNIVVYDGFHCKELVSAL